jgi:hypothetical protein
VAKTSTDKRTAADPAADGFLINGDGRVLDPLREPGREREPDQLAEPDVIDLLIEQHAWIEYLFNRVLGETGPAKAEAFDDLVRMLSVHETGEEQVVHPVSKALLTEGTALVDARLDEEQEAKKLLQELTDADVADPSFDEQLLTLRLMALSHARREERLEFGRLRHLAPAGQLRAMATALTAAQAVAPTRPHPSVRSATANTLAGPPMAIVDRVRDLFRDSRRRRQDAAGAS